MLQRSHPASGASSTSASSSSSEGFTPRGLASPSLGITGKSVSLRQRLTLYGAGRGAFRRRRLVWFLLLGALGWCIWLYAFGYPSALHAAYEGISSSPRSALAISRGTHPIDVLLKRGEETFARLNASQSTTLQEGVREYKRRYGRNPPKGFDKWWDWAKIRGITLMDAIHRDLEPFWGLSPAQIEERRVSLLDQAKSDHFLPIYIKDGVVGDYPGLASSEKWPQNKDFFKLFAPFADALPDMNILINLYDLPVGYVSYEERQRLIAAGRAGVYAPDEEEIPAAPEVLDSSWGLSVEDLRTACAPDSPARQYNTDVFNNTVYPERVTQGLDWRLPREQGSFVYDVQAAGDLCRNPALEYQHGNFLKAYLFFPHQRNRLYPVFSWSRYLASTDITLPSNYRWQYGPADRAKWADMTPAVAWRGGLTGMFADTRKNPWGTEEVLTLDEKEGRLSLATVFRHQLQKWFDIGIQHKNYNRKSEAEKMVEDVILEASYMDNKERSKHKILLDIDGWGWSARYRELLRTSSAVMKTTVFHEAISDWLVPWYHYIPINYDYTDMHSVLLYFFGEPDAGQPAHDDELRAIAERSQVWADTHLEWSHQATYIYRLCLEWARITAEDRASMDYTG